MEETILKVLSNFRQQNQSGAAEAWWAHNPQVPGSKPGSDMSFYFFSHFYLFLHISFLTHKHKSYPACSVNAWERFWHHGSMVMQKPLHLERDIS